MAVEIRIHEVEIQVKTAIEMAQAQLETNLDFVETCELRGRIKAFRIVLGLIREQRGTSNG